MNSLATAYHFFFSSAWELVAFITGVVGVWLMARQSLWAWPVGIANVLIYAAIFLEFGLYADASLQLYFLALLIYGWWHWLHPGPQQAELPVGRLTARATLAVGLVTTLATAAIGVFLDRYTDSKVPYWDAVTCALSLAAQWMQARKLLENWAVWIVADVLYIGLYVFKQLNGTAVLYAIFIALAVKGHVEWQRARRAAVATA